MILERDKNFIEADTVKILLIIKGNFSYVNAGATCKTIINIITLKQKNIKH
jgi:hypothetical protein